MSIVLHSIWNFSLLHLSASAPLPTLRWSVKNTCIMDPTRLVTCGIPHDDAASSTASAMCLEFLSSLSYMAPPSLSMTLSDATAALTASGFPAKVLAWYTGPDGASSRIILFLPPTAAIPNPLLMAFAMVVMSGLTL